MCRFLSAAERVEEVEGLDPRVVSVFQADVTFQ
jgi:hypothetical protein